MLRLDGARTASRRRRRKEFSYSLRPLLQSGYAGRGADSAVMDFRAAAVDGTVKEETVARIIELLPITEFEIRLFDMYKLNGSH
jgi:hypothetical protein